MAKQRQGKLVTPKRATLSINRDLERDLKDYWYCSNAELCTIEDDDTSPVWVIQALVESNTHYVILREKDEMAYIWTGALKVNPIIPQGQLYERMIVRDDEYVMQFGTVEYNKDMEVCIRWKDAH